MLFVTEYSFRPFMDREASRALLTLFGERGEEEGTLAHYVKADGTGGVLIIEQDSAEKAYTASYAYAEFIDFKTTPVLPIADAVGVIMKALA